MDQSERVDDLRDTQVNVLSYSEHQSKLVGQFNKKNDRSRDWNQAGRNAPTIVEKKIEFSESIIEGVEEDNYQPHDEFAIVNAMDSKQD